MAARAALDAAVAAASRDVVLYEHDRSRFFRLVGLFCAGQGLLWAYLARFAFTALRPVPAPGAGTDDPLRPRDNKWRFGFTASCLTVGTPGHRGDITGTPGQLREPSASRGQWGHHGDTGTPGGHHRDSSGSLPLVGTVRGQRGDITGTPGQLRERRLFDVTVGVFSF
ncbi:transmembrane protein 223 isoform X2 [Pyrgilauda ruficollis]|uniref:transmembrane protein 223 isoform X2 n=1 Tax=Pyrgilauda ruficollis TaxID=221976 RepID=UPI001B877576|nr:transmembrane protein 223 isoform X2 [Pyrgilauda ruficollis]